MNVNVAIPRRVRAAAKQAADMRGITMAAAVTEALDAWSLAQAKRAS
ncbi:MAG TPA: hypothetical protein VGH28_26890 [Polyangiaceae bacterium]